MLREHWPGDRGALFTLLMLGTYMDGKGAMAWPTIETLAADTGQSERTVRRHIDRALELDFLSSWKTRAPMKGRAWRRTYYQAHIPGSLSLSPDDDALANTVGSIDDEASQIIREPTTEQPYADANRRRFVEAPSKGARTGHHPLEDRTNQTGGPDMPDGSTGHQRPRGVDISAVDTRLAPRTGHSAAPLKQKAQENGGLETDRGPDTSPEQGPDTTATKSSSEVFISSSHRSPPCEATAGAAVARAFRRDSPKEDPRDQERKAVVWLRQFPEASNKELHAMFQVSPEKAADLRQLAREKSHSGVSA
jgi:hypothetical protein